LPLKKAYSTHRKSKEKKEGKKMVGWKRKEKYKANPVTRTEFYLESGHAGCVCVLKHYAPNVSYLEAATVGEGRKEKLGRLKMICFLLPTCFLIFSLFLEVSALPFSVVSFLFIFKTVKLLSPWKRKA
jgi:hypothetical protein